MRYTENNTSQCWGCRNRVGTGTATIHRDVFELPECKVEDKYMLEVYELPCRRYEPNKQLGGDTE